MSDDIEPTPAICPHCGAVFLDYERTSDNKPGRCPECGRLDGRRTRNG